MNGHPNRHVTVKSQNGSLLNRIADDRGNVTFGDEPEDKGGTGKGLTPFELVGSGLGACTSMTLIMYARRRNSIFVMSSSMSAISVRERPGMRRT